ncbi:hypothetical protein C9374_009963 [Naegleria lovaniensis]|uniref:Uncharacterized protein n=1 Tax=Naegleria lovaniensis TaxID=51637 RepID=A0AA88GH21_NAELO|nr:uncharacterized protein C9374_009963 [Naegleria lovaniensis]KAG2375340.1 hypothetical protein C9374_009963 [Naegleria lovaniensis]
MHEGPNNMNENNNNSSSPLTADHLRWLLFRHQNLRALNDLNNHNNNYQERRWDSKADVSKSCSMSSVDHLSPLITTAYHNMNTTSMKTFHSQSEKSNHVTNERTQEKQQVTQKGLSCLEPKWLKQKFECDMARSSPTPKIPSNDDLDQQPQTTPPILTTINQTSNISSEKKQPVKSTQIITKSKKKAKKRSINTNPKNRRHATDAIDKTVATVENSQQFKSFNAAMVDLFKDYTEKSDLSLTSATSTHNNSLYSKFTKYLKRFNFWWTKWKKEFTAATIHRFLRSYDPLMRTFECLLLFFDTFHFPMAIRLFTHRVRHFLNLIFQFLYTSLFLLEENSEAERELLMHSNNNYYNDSQIYQTDPYYYYDDVNYYSQHHNPNTGGDPFT